MWQGMGHKVVCVDAELVAGAVVNESYMVVVVLAMGYDVFRSHLIVREDWGVGSGEKSGECVVSVCVCCGIRVGGNDTELLSTRGANVIAVDVERLSSAAKSCDWEYDGGAVSACCVLCALCGCCGGVGGVRYGGDLGRVRRIGGVHGIAMCMFSIVFDIAGGCSPHESSKMSGTIRCDMWECAVCFGYGV